MFFRWTGAVMAAVLAMAALSACGSSGGSKQSSAGKSQQAKPKAQVVAKGDAVCRKYNKRVDKALSALNFDPTHANSAKLKKAGSALENAASLLTEEVDQVEAQGPPDKQADLFKQVIAKAKRIGPQFQQAAQAAKRGDVKGFEAALSKVQSNSSNANKPARQFGLKVCGQG